MQRRLDEARLGETQPNINKKVSASLTGNSQAGEYVSGQQKYSVCLDKARLGGSQPYINEVRLGESRQMSDEGVGESHRESQRSLKPASAPQAGDSFSIPFHAHLESLLRRCTLFLHIFPYSLIIRMLRCQVRRQHNFCVYHRPRCHLP